MALHAPIRSASVSHTDGRRTSSGFTFSTSFVRRSRSSTTPSFKPFRANGQSQRHAEQIGVLELDARAQPFAIVVQDFEAGAFEIRFDLIGDGGDLGLRRIEADEMHVIRRDRPRPDDAVGVVVLLDHRGDRPRDADAVAAHHHRTLGARLVQDTRSSSRPSTSCRA